MADLQVIGAGFGRTGTKSLWTALERLGFKTHHMSEVFDHPESLVLWERVASEGMTDELFEKLFADYQVCLPCAVMAVLCSLLDAGGGRRGV